MTSDWLFLAGYLAPVVPIFRKSVVQFSDHHAREFPTLREDGDDRFFFAVFSLMIAAAWPLVLVLWVAYRFVMPQTPAQRKDDLRQREWEANQERANLRRREDEIRQMERDLGIGGDR